MTVKRINSKLITKEGVERILSFIPQLAEDDSIGPEIEKIDNEITIEPSHFSVSMMSFIHACYEEHFVQPFDWMKWSSRNSNKIYTDDFISSANISTIIKLLTTHIRADRFCEGHLVGALKDKQLLKF